MKRAILLQTEATGHKLAILKDFGEKAVRCSNWILSKRNPKESAADLQARVLHETKQKYGFNVQVVCSLVRGLAKSRSDVVVAGTTVKFNVPRNCKTFRTKGFFFVELGVYPGQRVAIPIRRNRNLDRFFGLIGSGWNCKTYGLTPSLEICAYLSKDDDAQQRLPCEKKVLGVDINAKNFAYTVMTAEGEVLKQGYLGQQMWSRKRHFEERRDLLRSLNAVKKLRRMRRRQRDYVKTNLGQMVREIIFLAKKYEAGVSIEKLSRFRPKGRRFNRKVMTIPFRLFESILTNRCFDNGVALNRVDAYHTSKWCSSCGAVGSGHEGSNYSLFRCNACGQVVNSDRKASLAVAVKTFLERSGFPNQPFQISGRRVPVSGLLRPSPMAQGQIAVLPLAQGRGKPTGFSRG